MIQRRTLAAGLAAASLVRPARAAAPRLETVFQSDLVTNGVATTHDGRMFLPVQPQAPGTGPQLIEAKGGKPVPYPDAAWNGWKPGDDTAHAFVGLNAIRIGPDGALWCVDRGAGGMGKPVVPGGTKLVRIDVGTNRVTRTIDLGAVIRPDSFVDDVRFNGPHAYLTDAGPTPALIVLELATGRARRVLENHPSTVSQKPLRAEGRALTKPDGSPAVINADQLEVSPDRKWLYYQPSCGGMSRIETRVLDDPAADLPRHVQPFADTPSTGGTAMDAAGTMYYSDTDRNRVLTVSPQGRLAVLIADPRLVWVDAMWIDDRGGLLMAACQIDRTAGFNGGTDAVRMPTAVYRLPLGIKPLRT